jgi:hypothetical protein
MEQHQMELREEQRQEEEEERLANPSLYDDLEEEGQRSPELPTDTALTEDPTPSGDLDDIDSSPVEETVF